MAPVSLKRSPELKLRPEGRDRLGPQRGMSLIEVLVALGVMSAMALIMLVLNDSQQRELRAMDEKMAMLNLQTLLTLNFASSDYCRCVFAGQTFNYQDKTWNGVPDQFEASYLPGSCTPSSATPLLRANQKFVGGGSITFLNVQFDNLSEVLPLGTFTSNLLFKVNQEALVRRRADISIPLRIVFDLTSGSPTARSVSSCSSIVTGGPIDLATLCGQMNGYFNGTTCEPTYQ